VQVRGPLRRTKTGEPSVFVEQMTLLAKAINPPPEKWHGLTDVEARLRERYLDLIVNDEVRRTFRTRTKLVTTMRRFLDGQGFLEVETPVLQQIYGGASARPFVTHHNQLHQDLYLRIALELYLKRLIVGGFEKVYEIGRNFRNEGVDRSHNPEFTMMECYQAYADYHDMMRLVEDMLRTIALELTGGTVISYQGQQVDFGPEWQRVPLAEAIDERSGIDITRYTDQEALWAAIVERKLRVERKPTWAKQIDELFSTYVEPTLIQPTFMVDYPVALSPLAKRKPGDGTFVERFEAFAVASELGNAFTELNDPFDQEQRFLEQGRDFAAGDADAQQMDVADRRIGDGYRPADDDLRRSA
jgi:lysyl-tRNA synthetase, class II